LLLLNTKVNQIWSPYSPIIGWVGMSDVRKITRLISFINFIRSNTMSGQEVLVLIAQCIIIMF